MTGINAEVIARRVAPLLSRVIIVIACTLTLTLGDILASLSTSDIMALADILYTEIHRCRDKDIDNILMVTEDIICRSANEDTTAFISRLTDSITLELVKALIREAALIEIALTEQRHMNMEPTAEEAFLLVVLFEELLREATLLSRKVKQFLIIELATELLCKHLGDYPSATAYLSANVYNYIIHLVFEFLSLLVF